MGNVDTILIVWLYVWVGFKFFEGHDLSVMEKFWAIIGWPVGVMAASLLDTIRFLSRKP